MTETHTSETRILSVEQKAQLAKEIFGKIDNEPWKDAAYANLLAVKSLISNGIDMIQGLEEETHGKHPKIHTDTDIVYIDSGPGPYSYKMLPPGKSDIEDSQYHQWPWTRKMDRARIRAAYALTSLVTAKRLEEQTGVIRKASELTKEDYEKYSPYLMYASTTWQNLEIKRAVELEREAGNFLIPDDKLIMYEDFTTSLGKQKPIVNTADQIEGFHFPPFDGKAPPRRIVMVSHPAHLMRIMHILGKYPQRIPAETTLQLFPIPTPTAAGQEYTKVEISGALAYIFRKDRATLTPFTRYEV